MREIKVSIVPKYGTRLDAMRQLEKYIDENDIVNIVNVTTDAVMDKTENDFPICTRLNATIVVDD